MKQLYYWLLDQGSTSIEFLFKIPISKKGDKKKNTPRAFVSLPLVPYNDTKSLPAAAKRRRLTDVPPTGSNRWLKFLPKEEANASSSATPNGFAHWVGDRKLQQRTGVQEICISNIMHNSPVTWVDRHNQTKTVMLKKLRQDCTAALARAPNDIGAGLDEISSSDEEEEEEEEEVALPPPPCGSGARVARTFSAVQAATIADATPPPPPVAADMNPALQLCVSVLGSAEAVVAAARRGMDEGQRQLLDQAMSLGEGLSLDPVETFAEGGHDMMEDLMTALETDDAMEEVKPV